MSLWYRMDPETKLCSPCEMMESQLGDVDLVRVGRDEVYSLEHGFVGVSTVFLCLDHSFGWPGVPHVPLLFETMVFVIEEDGEWNMLELDMYRCSTYEQAVVQHRKVCHALVAQLRMVNGEGGE